jgi:hypothetical protein
MLVGRFVDAWTFTPAYVICGLLYPVGLAIVLLTVRRVERIPQPVEESRTA